MATNNSTNSGYNTLNGELVIGSTGQNPVPATLTGGTGIQIVNGPGSITINSIGGGLDWTVVTGATQAISVENGYVANYIGGVLDFTLPSTAAVGDIFMIMGQSATFFMISQNAGQSIHFGSLTTTIGVGGSVTSTNQNDVITIRCLVANTEFSVTDSIGNFTIV